jgi:hypothetical protein
MKTNLLLLSFLFISCTAFSQGNNGLVAHWNFNGNANDVSGNSLNGVVTGAILAPGYNNIANTAYSFNGTNNRIDVAYNALLNIDTGSLCVLLKVTSFYTGACQNSTILARSQYSGTSSTPAFYNISFDDNGFDDDCAISTLSHETFNASFSSSSFPSHTSWYANNDTITLNTWYCVTATYKSDSIKLYINGTLRKTLFSPSNYGPNLDSLTIGCFSDGVGGGYPYWFHGVIDDIRLYNRPLSATEVVEYCDTAKMLPSTAISFVSNETPEIIVSPNPAHNNINILLSENANNNKIQLINSVGVLIAELKPESASVTIDISNLPPGLYIVRAECEGQIVYKKILKE